MCQTVYGYGGAFVICMSGLALLKATICYGGCYAIIEERMLTMKGCMLRLQETAATHPTENQGVEIGWYHVALVQNQDGHVPGLASGHTLHVLWHK